MVMYAYLCNSVYIRPIFGFFSFDLSESSWTILFTSGEIIGWTILFISGEIIG
jgi:hypothetical protein